MSNNKTNGTVKTESFTNDGTAQGTQAPKSEAPPVVKRFTLPLSAGHTSPDPAKVENHKVAPSSKLAARLLKQSISLRKASRDSKMTSEVFEALRTDANLQAASWSSDLEVPIWLGHAVASQAAKAAIAHDETHDMWDEWLNK